MSRPLRTLIFDLDDTLLRTSDVYARAVNDFLQLMVAEGFGRREALSAFEVRESRNIDTEGYDPRRYQLSMREAYETLCKGRAGHPKDGTKATICDIARRVTETVPNLVLGAQSVLRDLERDYDLLLLPRGHSSGRSSLASLTTLKSTPRAAK